MPFNERVGGDYAARGRNWLPDGGVVADPTIEFSGAAFAVIASSWATRSSSVRKRFAPGCAPPTLCVGPQTSKLATSQAHDAAHHHNHRVTASMRLRMSLQRAAVGSSAKTLDRRPGAPPPRPARCLRPIPPSTSRSHAGLRSIDERADLCEFHDARSMALPARPRVRSSRSDRGDQCDLRRRRLGLIAIGARADQRKVRRNGGVRGRS